MYKYWTVLRDDDPENNGGDNDTEVVIPEGDELVDKPEGDVKPTGEAKPKTVVKPKVEKQELTDERIAEIAARVSAKSNQRQEQREEPRLTQEEVDKLLNPVRVSREDMAEIMGIEDPVTISDKRLQKFQAMLSATVKNAASIGNVALEARMRKVMEQAGPMQEYYQQAQAKAQTDAFYERHENLKKYGRIVKAAASQVTATKDMTVDQAMDAVAAMAKDMLKDAGIDPDAEVEGDENESGVTDKHSAGGTKPVPKMASLQKSGRSGAPTKTGGGNNPDADIYG